MKIRAAVLEKMGAEAPYEKSKPLTIEEFDLDDPGPGEVMVKICAAGLCHSDLSVIDGNRPRPTPMVLGHEAAGVVEKLGPGVDDLKVGDHVVMVFVPSCGHCLPCAEGRPALCEPGAVANGAGTLLSGERRLHRNGTAVHHHLAELRALPALRGGPSRAVRTRCGRQRCRHAALRRAPAAPQRHRCPPSSRRAAGTACPARRAVPRCANPVRSPTVQARCSPASAGCTATAPLSTIISASRLSPNT